MKRALVLPALLLVGAAVCRADDPPKAKPKSKPFSASFIGEGGSYKHPDEATSDYLENADGGPKDPGAAAVPGHLAPAAPQARPAVLPPSDPTPIVSAPTRPAAPRTGAPSRSLAARPAAEGRNAPVPGAAPGGGRQSLWNGLVQPLAMPGAAAATADADDARAAGDSDYESHILGLKPSAPRPALGAAAAPAPAPVPAPAQEVASVRTGAGDKLFVSFELDPREAGSLRDAVAGLGSAAGFAADARFQMTAAANGRALVSGWIPASQLAAALARPGVKSVRVETKPRPSAPSETSGDFLIGLRVRGDGARASEDARAGVQSLKDAAGFKLSRVVGLETAPDGRAVAVVAGSLPLSRLQKALDLSEVAKITPLGYEAPASAPKPAPPAPGGLAGFARFAVRRGLWLIVFTLALALPDLRQAAGRALSVFSPYR